MANTRCCRFHNVVIALLVLSVFSFAGHFVIDIVHPPHQQTLAGQWQGPGDNSLNGQEVGHLTSLHSGYILAETTGVGLSRNVIAPEGLFPPHATPWWPPTPLRPPISL